MPERSPSDSLALLRHNLADDAFLLQHVYTRENSKFLGGTTRYLVSVGLPEDRRVIEARLLSQLSRDLQADSGVSWMIAHYVRQLPAEIATRVELPHDVPAENSVQACLELGRSAIADSLRAKTPYAWVYSSISRLASRRGQATLSADECESVGLLENYHDWGVRQARLRFPEVWDMARGHFIFDSRGVPFARELIRQLKHRGLLSNSQRFLDVGSGIGSMAACVALWSDARAFGIELHAGLSRLAGALVRRMISKGVLDPQRIELCHGNVLLQSDIDIGQFDVLYLYSPLGCQELELDPIVARMRPGTLIVSAHLPRKNLELISLEPRLINLFVMRRQA